MADLTPLTSVFTSAGLLLETGAKVTMEILNKVVDNTGFNWMGGRHPMRESIGILDVERTDLQSGEDTSIHAGVNVEVFLSSRSSGVAQFSSGETYNVQCTMQSGRDISYNVDRNENDDLDASYGIDSNYYDITSVVVVDQEFDRFTIRLEIPQPFLPNPTTYRIAWIAKGY